MKEVQNFIVAIIGAGTMGLGTATHFAVHGHRVQVQTGHRDRAEKQFADNLKSLQESGIITADAAAAANKNLQFFSEMKDAVASADFILENVPENEEIKKKTFGDIAKYADHEAIIASNTSSLNIYELANVPAPERLVITHFFVPAYVMPLVEIVKGPETSAETVEKVYELMSTTGKKPAVVNKVVPGFIMNRLTFALFREAAYMVDQGWCSPEDIDRAVVATYGPRDTFEGPFALVDSAGVDTYEKISEYLLPELCSSGDVPQSLKKRYEEGHLGVKSQQGYYKYEDPEKTRTDRANKIVRMIQAIDEVNKEF